MSDRTRSEEINLVCQDYKYALDKVASGDPNRAQNALSLTQMALSMQRRRSIFRFIARIFGR